MSTPQPDDRPEPVDRAEETSVDFEREDLARALYEADREPLERGDG